MGGCAALAGALGAAVALGGCTSDRAGAVASAPPTAPASAVAQPAGPPAATAPVAGSQDPSAPPTPDAGTVGGPARATALALPRRVRGELARYTVALDATGKRTSSGVVLVNSAAVPGRRYVVEAGCAAVEPGQRASFGIVSYSGRRTRQPPLNGSVPCDGRPHLVEHRPDGTGRIDVVPGPEIEEVGDFYAVVRPARPGEVVGARMTSYPVPDLKPPVPAAGEVLRVTGESGPTAAQVTRAQAYVVTAACTGDRPGVTARWHLDAAEAASSDDEGDGSVASGSVECTGTAATTVRTLAVSGVVILDVDRIVNGYATQYWVTMTPAG